MGNKQKLTFYFKIAVNVMTSPSSLAEIEPWWPSVMLRAGQGSYAVKNFSKFPKLGRSPVESRAKGWYNMRQRQYSASRISPFLI